MKKHLIGILAGMGPRSTAPFLELVIDQCKVQYGAKYDEDFPPIMIYSLPTPFFIDRPINHILMKDTIIEGLKKLESTEVNFIVMPCNSAHIYFDELEKSIVVPLLNIVNVTIDSIPPRSRRVTIFGTVTTLNSEIYQKGIIAAGYEFTFQTSWQERINKIIQMIKIKENEELIESGWNELISEAVKNSIDTIIIACTDLSILKNRTNSEVNIIDSAEALAQVTVKRYISQ